jgi:Kef-type K+ transport system membrane component KefB
VSPTYVPVVMAALVLVASLVSIRFALSVAVVEIVVGVIAGNAVHLHTTPYIDFLAGFGSILLTFLAGAEVDTALLKTKFKQSVLIGFFSFLLPFAATFLYCYLVAGWSMKAAEIGGVALSTTSLAVVYAVLVETGLTSTDTGKIIMASCFITDLGTVVALSVLFANVNWWTLGFYLISIALIFLGYRYFGWFVQRFGGRVIEPDIKLLFFVLFVLMLLGQLGNSHAVLPAFILGLALSGTFMHQKDLQRKLRVIAFGIVTPFFFVKGGINVSLAAFATSGALIAILFFVKVAAKFVGVLPLARKYVPRYSLYTTLLMSTGLTFGTIASTYGLQAGYITQTQFSVLLIVVIATAVIPTAIAQRFFQPRAVPQAVEPASLLGAGTVETAQGLPRGVDDTASGQQRG